MNEPMHLNLQTTISSLSARLWRWHQEFWTAPVDATSAAIVRILLGLFSAQHALLIIPFSADFFGGSNPTVSFNSAVSTQTQPVLSLFCLFPAGPPLDFAASAMPVVELVAALFVMVGLRTRSSLVVLYLVLVSMVQRNNQITYGADIYQIALVFFLFFANSAGRLSLDAVWARHRNRPLSGTTLPVARNLIRFHLLFVYLQAFLTKAVHQTWQDGTALWYVLHNENFQLLPFPAGLLTLEMSKILTWSTLALEATLLVGLFFKPIRYPLLLVGILFHIGMDVFLNIPLFQRFVVTSYIFWFDEKDVRVFVDKLVAAGKGRFRRA